MTNAEAIEKYKLENVILSSDYKKNDISIDGIVNPISLDFRQLCSPTDNQHDDPHCAGYAAAQMIESFYWKETGHPIQLDAHQIYAKAKEIDGHPDVDGTLIEATLSCALKLCPFIDENKFDVKTFHNDKSNHTLEKIKTLIHKHTFLLGGFMITDKWYQAREKTNVIKPGGDTLGGHAVLICGYLKDNIIIQNSWGKKWASKGFAQIPAQVFLKQFIYCAYLKRR